eukprot:TRINITY_DN12104_c0_g2_i1.p1 TRINITY_DN12104_c0_g2~~TRINITY_DN12104_c0_g2_i1.p1  ORF type:complete len:355 (-),score=115.78 TRINITY_DN12104_c0_g2_i1:8-1072(-)
MATALLAAVTLFAACLAVSSATSDGLAAIAVPSAGSGKEPSLAALTELWAAHPEDVATTLARLSTGGAGNATAVAEVRASLEKSWQAAAAAFLNEASAGEQEGKMAASMLEQESSSHQDDRQVESKLAAIAKARQNRSQAERLEALRQEVKQLFLKSNSSMLTRPLPWHSLIPADHGAAAVGLKPDWSGVPTASPSNTGGASLLEAESAPAKPSVVAWVSSKQAQPLASESVRDAIEEVVKLLGEPATYRNLTEAAAHARETATQDDGGAAVTNAVLPIIQGVLGDRLARFGLNSNPLSGLMQLHASAFNGDAAAAAADPEAEAQRRKLQSIMKFLLGTSDSLDFGEAESKKDM